jgi:hypothetical protein
VPRVYATPEAAARGELPEPFARALALTRSPDGSHALVLLGCNDPSNAYPCQVLCHRAGAEDGWIERASSYVPGWTALNAEHERGVLSAWGPAPPETRTAVVAFDDREHEVAISHGHYVFAAWDVPSDKRDAPSVRRFV